MELHYNEIIFLKTFWDLQACNLCRFISVTVNKVYRSTSLQLCVLQLNYKNINEICNIYKESDDMRDSWEDLEKILKYFGDSGSSHVNYSFPGSWNYANPVIKKFFYVMHSLQKGMSHRFPILNHGVMVRSGLLHQIFYIFLEKNHQKFPRVYFREYISLLTLCCLDKVNSDRN